MKWLTHRGGACPVNENSLVLPRIRVLARSDAEKRAPTAAKGWIWRHRNSPGDIMEFVHFGEAA